jgi:hypothetical protein
MVLAILTTPEPDPEPGPGPSTQPPQLSSHQLSPRASHHRGVRTVAVHSDSLVGQKSWCVGGTWCEVGGAELVRGGACWCVVVYAGTWWCLVVRGGLCLRPLMA